MPVRPSLIRSIPFWILVVGSLAVTVAGAAIVFGTLPGMIAGLTDQTATTAQVYGGQSWIVVGAALLGAGAIGLVAVLALAVVSSLLRVVEAPQSAAIVADDELVVPGVYVAAPESSLVEEPVVAPVADDAAVAAAPESPVPNEETAHTR